MLLTEKKRVRKFLGTGPNVNLIKSDENKSRICFFKFVTIFLAYIFLRHESLI